MKKIAIIALLVCSFLGTGCSRSEEETAKVEGPRPSATMKPIVDPTQKVIERRREVPLKRADAATPVVTEPTATPAP
jgi:hypothetical protein